MKILPTSCLAARIADLDKRIRTGIASRQEELRGVTGIRYVVRRIKIELWAWRKAFRESERYTGI